MKAQNIKNSLQFKVTVALIYVVIGVVIALLAHYFSTASIHVSL
jgi:ABC-type dipeptide/oligopeptide/nickel transport system permease subunit